ncbi:4972_t:CDS:1 [Paraglomus occultum]|uniref:4972_t:CDS:1 n=1 Tax=Paraglomus occultum TaxID=144539 RepID=A0A9N9DEH6_9GLOM|nr:4972_t:CDS:1 [Paraglomus occultum]
MRSEHTPKIFFNYRLLKPESTHSQSNFFECLPPSTDSTGLEKKKVERTSISDKTKTLNGALHSLTPNRLLATEPPPNSHPLWANILTGYLSSLAITTEHSSFQSTPTSRDTKHLTGFSHSTLRHIDQTI